MVKLIYIIIIIYMINMRLVKIDLGITKRNTKVVRGNWIVEIAKLSGTRVVIARKIRENGKKEIAYVFTRDMDNNTYTQYLRLLPKRIRDQVLDLLFEIALFG